MSAQGLNTTYLNANTDYRYTPPAANSAPGYPGVGVPAGPYATQFASDYTKRLKELRFYDEYKAVAPDSVSGVNTAYNNNFVVPVNYSIVQSNQNRKTYQFGKLGCVNCLKFPTATLGNF